MRGYRTTTRQERGERKQMEICGAEGETPVREWPGPSGKAKYSRETDSAQYREGKVKRTPDRGVKENLKPVAYKRSEPCGVMACLLHNDPTSCLAWRG